jgi:uncharacterized protein (TIGR03435 family)
MHRILGAALFATVVFGQSAPEPSFEVASIKAAVPPADGRLLVRMGGDSGRIDYTNVSLRDLLRAAYKVKDPQIVGPSWLGSERFDVVAKLPAGAKRDQVPAMLQTLLAERFKLKLHKEGKVLPAYELLPAKGGPKLHAAEGDGNLRMMMGPRGRHLSGKTNMQGLADTLSNWMDRPVIDKTELQGTYDVDLEWSGDEGPQHLRAMRGPSGPEGAPRVEGAPRADGGDGRAGLDNTDAPSLFTALQDKLGLRLEATKTPVDILIIDNIEKVPTEN